MTYEQQEQVLRIGGFDTGPDTYLTLYLDADTDKASDAYQDPALKLGQVKNWHILIKVYRTSTYIIGLHLNLFSIFFAFLTN